MATKEDARRCRKCGYQWWAVPAKKPPKLSWANDAFNLTGGSAARNVRLSHRHSEQLREWERWGLCARCGSQDVASVKPKGFMPTALNEANPVVPAAPPPTPQVPPSSGRPIQASPRDSSGRYSIGDRVVLQIFGLKGQKGVIVKITDKGELNIRLDIGTTVRGINPSKVHPE